MAVRIGELLLKEKRITPEQLQEALSYQRQSGGKLGANLVKLGFVKDEEITSLLSKQYGVPSISLNQFEIDPAVIKLVPAETAHKYQIIPLSRVGATLTIAMTDPTNVFALDDLKFMTGYNVEPVVAWETAVLDAIQKYYGAPGVGGKQSANQRIVETAPGESALEIATRAMSEMPLLDAGDVEVLEELEEISAEALTRQGEEAPVIKLVNVILMSAISKGASDIHVEPYEKEYRVRYRVDGILYNVMSPSLKMRDAITSRIKIMAKLDIAEKRLPQDGRIKIRFSDSGVQRDIDFRVSVLPTLFGEKIVMRLLDRTKLMLDMTKLGFEPESLVKLETADQQAVGHGAGHRPDRQRQDQHALLVDLADQHPRDQHHDRRGPGRVQPGRRQPGAGAREHRPELRGRAAQLPPPGPQHHPGRRDPRLRDGRDRRQGGPHRPPRAVDAAHQRRAEHDQPPDEHGHRALSRRQLAQPGVRPASGAPHLHRVQDRRPGAAGRRWSPSASRPELAETVVPKKGKGCEKCNRTGYKGRVGLYEVMDITEELRELILVGASSLELRRKAIEEGMITLRGSGLRKITDGVTTLEEVVRETVK